MLKRQDLDAVIIIKFLFYNQVCHTIGALNQRLWHNNRLIHGESAMERQKEDNAAKNALHHKSLGCSSLRQKDPACNFGDWAFSCPICSTPDRFTLKSLCSLMEASYILHRHAWNKNEITTLIVLELASRKVILHVCSLWIQERGKNQAMSEAWANASATVSRRNHEPHHANGKQVFFNRLSDRESQSRLKEMLLCSSIANFFGSSYWKTRKSKSFGGFRAATWTLCYGEGLDYYRIVVLFDRWISAGGSQLIKQRQEVDTGSDCGKRYCTKRGSIESISCTRRPKSRLSTILSDKPIAQAVVDTTIVVLPSWLFQIEIKRLSFLTMFIVRLVK